MSRGWTNLDAFLSERLVEREAEAALQGDTTFGRMKSLGVAWLSLWIEIVKVAPMPRWWRRDVLEWIAERHFGDHPDFSEWWRRR